MNANAQIDPASGPLVRYDAMVRAISECERVDEAKEIRDKAIALEAYYRQARNLEAERKAANVRLRAERRAGELLKALARAETPSPNGRRGNDRIASNDGTQFPSPAAATSTDRTKQQGRTDAPSPPPPPSPYARTLTETGMSRQQAHRFQALANVPAKEFEAALAKPEKPTASGIVKRAELKAEPPKPKVKDEALWLWGRLRDFERMGFFTMPPGRILDTMTDAMRSDVLRLAPHVSDFLTSLGERE